MKRQQHPGSGVERSAARRHLIALEPRMMFDGAAVATAATVADSDASHAAPPADDHAPPPAAGPDAADHHPTWQRDDTHYVAASYETVPEPVGAAPARVVIFIDTAVEDYESVAAEWADKGEIVLIDQTRDGMDQVLGALAGRSDLDAIHIVSHGSANRFMLGTTGVDMGSLSGDLSDAFAAIGGKLGADGDILIYGCDVTIDDAGQSFIDAIAARTGADVAASSDATGATALGGDWELESRSGDVAATTLVSDRYAGLLQLANPTGPWTINGSSGSTSIDGVNVSIAYTSGTGVFANTIADTLNNIAAFSNNAQGTGDVQVSFNGGTAVANATGTITITFSEAVTNPIIHVDRLGGVANGTSNSATLTLTTAGATLTKLTGSEHLLVTSTTVVRRTGVATAQNGESALLSADGTAAGSLRVNGTFTTITFGIQSSVGDTFELSTTADRRPDAIDDAFAINRGQTLTGNLYSANGGSADTDIRGDAFTITQINGAAFTANQPITLSTGTLTITNAATGAFTFVPRAAYPTTQTFTYTVADANGGFDTATATITVNDLPTVALNPTNLVANASFEDGTAWTAQSGAVEYNTNTPYGAPTPPAGTRVAEVEGAVGSQYIQQTITTVVGQQYSYSLQATTRANANAGDRGSLIVDGVKILDFTTDTTWKTYLATFTATSTSTVIRIQSEGSTSGSATGPADGSGLIVDDVQVRGINNTITYTENTAPLAITATGDRIVDFDSPNLTGSTVTLTNPQAGDRLLVGGSAAAAGTIGPISWTRTNTSVVFTGTATQAQYEAALRAVQFENTGDNPGTVSRTITVTATDGTATSNTATVTVLVTPVNDAPVNTLPASYTLAEDGTLSLNGLSVADADANAGTITVTLSVPTNSGVLNAANGGNVTVSGSGTRSLVLTGTLTDINAYLTATASRPTYAPVADFNGTVVLTMTTGDGGNSGTGTVLTDTDTTTITITPVSDIVADTITIDEDTTATAFVLTNDTFANSGARITSINGSPVTPTTSISTTPAANFNGSYTVNYTVTSGGVTENGVLNVVVRPVNDAPAGTDATLTAIEDTPYAFAAANFGFSDAVEGNAFAGIVVATLPGNGTLRLDGTAVTAGTFITAAQIAAGRLTWQAAPNANGANLGSFTFQVRDDGGTANGGTDTDQSPNTISFTVTPVNDAPAGTDGTAAAVEDTPVTLAAANFGFSDTVEGDAFAGVVITTLPANGTLRLNGTAVTAGNFITAAQIAGGQLTFQAAANANGAGLGSFTFQVRDTGGTAGGGIDTDQSPNTLSFTVAAQNDAPSGTDAVLAATEDTPYVFAAANFGFSDTVDGNAFAGVVITTLPANGTMLLNGNAVTAGTFVTAAQIAAGQLTFQAAANANGTGLGTFTFQVRDNGGTTNGGIDTDQSPNTISFTVASVNDAPAGTNATATAIEDTAYAITAANLGFSDVDGNAFAGVVITTLPANGTLRLNGTALTAGTFVTAAQVNAGQLTFQAAANANGTGLGAFTFQVRDNGGTAGGGQDTDQSPNTLNFNVTAVNDAPSGTDVVLAATEDTRYIFAANDFGFTDAADGNSFTGLVITTLPANGSLQLNGVPLTAGTFVTAAQIAANQLSWLPAANANGAGLGSFTFQVRDNGGTAGGGVDTDPSANTVSFTVAPANDPPLVDLNGAAVATLPVTGGAFDFPSTDTATDRTATASVDLTDIAPTSVNAVVGFAVIDNSFRIAVNGTTIGNTGFELLAADLAAGETLLRFADGTEVVTPGTANTNGLARVEVRMTATGITFFATRTTGSTGYEQLFAATGPIAGPSFTAGVNTIAVTNTVGGGVEQARGTITVSGEPTAYAATFTEGGSAVAIAPAAAYIGDIDTAAMTAATITLTNPQTGDQLLVNGSAAANGTVNGISYTRTANGVALSGSFTQAQYADALRLITFGNTGDDPNGAVVRDITVTVSDGNLTSNTAHSRITVVPVNDAIANIVRNYTVAEDGTLTLTGLSVTDPDAGAGAITVNLSVPAGSGTLTAASANGVIVAGSGGATLSLSGTLTDINAYLAAGATQPIFRQAAADFNGSVTLTMTSNDNGNSGTGGATQAVSTATIAITAVVDIAADTASVNEDGTVTIAPLANDSFEGVAQITAIDGQSIAQGGSIAVTGGSVRLDNGQLVFTAAPDVNGNVSFTYTVTSGGVTETASVTVAISAVNDRPTIVVPGTIAATEDTASPLTGITVADRDATGVAIRVTLSVPAGTLAFTAGTGVSATGSGTGTLVLTGTADAINAAIAASAVRYTSALNANGSVALSVTVNDLGNAGIDPGISGDSSSEETSATAVIAVSAVNDAPVAADDSFATSENTAVTIAVLANDTDIDTGTLTVTRINGTAIVAGGSIAVTGGQVTLNANNTLTFTPTTGFSGAPTFNYTISDGALTSTATVFGVVGAINHAPEGTDATIVIAEDATRVLATADFGYRDPLDGNAFAGVVIASVPANGILTLNGVTVQAGAVVTTAQINAGQLRYTPASNVNGTAVASFTFRVRDDGGTANGGQDTDQSANTIRFDVTPVNDAPSGTDAVLTATEDTPVVIDTASFGFSDLADGNAFAGVVITTLPSGATLSVNGTAVGAGQFVSAADIAGGRLIWAPAANANGADLGGFTFQVRDTGGTAGGGVDTDASANRLSFNVAAVNDAPVAVADSFIVAEDGSIALDVRGNDTDVDAGTVLTVTAVNGTAVVVGGPAVPITGGTVALDGQGRLVFTAAPDFNGPVAFAYTVRDQAGATATANVTGTVTPVTDPVVNIAIAAVTSAEDTRIVFGTGVGRPLAVSNPDGGVMTVTLTVSNGVLTLSGAAGLSFISGDGAADATMTFSGTAAAINAALEGLAFDPVDDFNGAAELVLQSTRNADGANDRDVVALTITPVADIAADSVTTTEDRAITFNVLTGANGAEPDTFENAGRIVTAVTQPAAGQGSVTFAADGTVTFTPATDFTGIASFTYTVASGGVSETATVTVTVTAVDDAPVLDLDGQAAGTGYAGTYIENAAGVPITGVGPSLTDVDSAALTRAVVRIGNGSAGDVLSVGALPGGITASYDAATYTLTLSGTATPSAYRQAIEAVRYASTANDPDTAIRLITVTVDDGAATSAATAQITVVPVNDAPTGTNATLSATEDTPFVFRAVDFGFGDVAEGDAFAGIVITTVPANGTMRVGGVAVTTGQFVTAAQIAAGQFSWQAAANANGAGLGAFTFQVRDDGGTANGGVDTDPTADTISFTVAAINDAPMSSDTAVTIAEDGVLSGQLPAYTDVDGDIATYRGGTTTPANGSVVINGNGTYTYTPDANFNGTDLFSFIVDDGRGGTVEEYVTITVTPANDAPVVVSPIPDRSRPDGATVSFDASTYFADPADGDTLSFTAIGLPAGLSIGADGLIAGTIDRAASQGGVGGVYTVTVTASDGKGGVVSDTFQFTVTNPAPTAVNDTVTTAEDTAVTLNVLTGAAGGLDTDPDGDPLTVTSATAGRGTVTIGVGGLITYTPDADFTGTDTIIYTISDGNGGIAQAVVNVTVSPTNDAPVAQPAADQLRNDGDVIAFDASSQFDDVDSDILTYGATGLPPGLSIDPATGLISGTIAPGASGPTGTRTYPVTITADDGQGGRTPLTIGFVVANIAPSAGDDMAVVNEDASVDIAVLANDTDTDGDTTLILRVNNQPLVLNGAPVDTANGRVQLVSVNGQQVLRYTPDADYNGAESFTYTIDDGNGGVDTAVVNISVTPVNDAPVSPQPIADQVRADGQSFGFDAGDFFVDPDGDALSFAATNLPAGLTINAATGVISGTIDRGASQGGPTGNGIYAVTIVASDGSGLSQARSFTLTVTNPSPAAFNDAVTTPEDVAVTVPVLANDADAGPDSDTLTVIGAQAGHGSVVIQANGTLLYTPNADYNGSDTIVYTISDGNGGTSTASVLVTVTAVNDLPTARPVPTIVTTDDAVIDFDLGSYFSDVDVGTDLDYTSTGTLPPGLTLDPETGRITGQLGADASNGTPYTTTITASDGMGGTVSTTITWNVQNLPPVAFADSLRVLENAGPTSGVNVLDNDVDPDNDGKVVSAVNGSAVNLGQPVVGSAGGVFVLNANGTYTFDPGTAFDDLQVGESRTTVISYLLDDTDGGFDTSFITVTIDGTNDAPVAAPIGRINGSDGESFTAKPIALGNFFSDVEGDTLVFSATGLPLGLTMNADGVITGIIDRDASLTSPYVVTVTADDGRATTTQTFEFAVADPAPTAVNDTAFTMEEQPVDILVVGNDTDPDGDTLRVDTVVAPQAANGAVTINPDGSLRYTPDANFTGTDTIIYRVSDGQGGFSTGIVNVSVGNVNDAPVGTDIPDTERNDGDQVMIGTAGYFTDTDGDTLTYGATGLPAGLGIDATTGVISGRIAAGASGPAGRTDYGVRITANDGQGGTTSVDFTVTAINIAPTAASDQATTLEDTAVIVAVLGNDADIDGDGVAIIRVNGVSLALDQSTPVAHGIVTLISDGGVSKLRFVPATDFNGTATFTYTIGDGNGGFDDAVVTIAVAAANDAPVVANPIPDRTRPDGASVSFDISPFFADVDADTLTFAASTLPPGLSIDAATGVITGTIAADASQGGVGGVYTVTITARDPAGATVAQTFDFTATNPPPIARNDSVFVAEDGSVTFDPITGLGTVGGAAGADSDPDGDPLRVVSVAGGQPIAPGTSVTLAEGTLSMNGTGQLTFTPFADVNVPVTITYTISDSNGGTAQAVITIDVSPINDAPTLDLNGVAAGRDNAVTFTEGDAPVRIVPVDVAAFDAEDDIVRVDITLGGFADGGAELLHLNGRVDLIAGTAVTGTIAFGDSDFRYTYDGGTSLVVINADGAGQPLSAEAISSFIRAIQYENRSDAPTAGDRTLGFVLTDTAGANTPVATATISVFPANDAPTSTPLAAQAGVDAAVVSLDLSGNFADADGPVTFAATGLPPGLAIDAATGIVSGTIDRSASLGSPYGVTVTATDGAGLPTQQSFTWTVANPAPIAVDDSATVGEDGTVAGDVTPGAAGQDSDPDGDPLQVTAVGGVTGAVGAAVAGSNGGVFTIGTDGSYTFAPGTDFGSLAAGTTRDTEISYTVSDGQGGIATARLIVTVIGANDAPSAGTLSPRPANDGDTLAIPTAQAFADPDAGDTLRFTATGLPAGLTIDAGTGEILGTLGSDASAGAPYSIVVTATDPGGATATTTLTLTVANLLPVAQNDIATTAEDRAVTGSVASNDADTAPDGDPLSFSLVTGPVNGTLIFEADGGYTYTPNANFAGTDSFTYKVDDGNGGTATASVTLSVGAVNDAPVAADDSFTVAEDGSVTFDVRTNDVDVDGPALTVVAIDGVAVGVGDTVSVIGGTVTLGADGAITFTPAANYNGTPQFSYVVSDGTVSATATVRGTVTPVNDAPIATGTPATTAEDTAATGQVTAGDVDGDALDFTLTTAPTNGTVLLGADGRYTYTPNADYFGPDSFTVAVGDARGGQVLVTIPVTVTAVNDAPTATAVPIETIEDTGVDGTIVATDIDGDTLGYAVATAPANGTVIVNADGTYRYTPNPDYAGPDSFTVAVSDGRGGQVLVGVAVTVTPVNDAPVATADPLTTSEDNAASGRIVVTDADGDTLGYALATAPANGVAVLGADGSYTYTPDADYVGPDSFTISVGDGRGGTVLVTVPVTVTPANDAPTASADPVTTPEDTGVDGRIVAADAEGDPLDYTLASAPANGTVVVNPDGTYRYTPRTDFTGVDSFTVAVVDGRGGQALVSVAVTVTPVNDAPTATVDPLSTIEDNAVVGRVVAADVDGDTLVFTLATAPANGAVMLAADGSYTYTPNRDFAGDDGFAVLVADGRGGQVLVTIPVMVAAVNDAPTASPQALTVTEDRSATGQIVAGDVDGDPLSYALATAPTNGSVVVNADGSYTYTPRANFAGSDSFTVALSDGRGAQTLVGVAVSVTPVNDAPTASATPPTTPEDRPVTGQIVAADPDGDALTFTLATAPTRGGVTIAADGSYRYIPDADFAGTDSFAIAVTDGQGGRVIVTVPVTVTPVNDAPTAASPPLSVTEDSAATGRIVAGDVDGDALTYTLTTAPTRGSLALNTDGSFRYTPNADATGSDSFTVVVGDGRGGSTSVTVPVTITGTNDAPTATAAPSVTAEDVAVTGRIVAGDVDSDPLTFTLQTAPTRGSVTINADGTYRYVPAADANGSDSFVVLVGDGRGGSVAVTVPITVTPVNDTPLGNAPALVVDPDTSGSGRIVASDVDGDQLGFTLGTPPANGTVAIAADGSYTYTPAAGFIGTDRFTMTVTDGRGGTVSVTIPVTVAPAGPPPADVNALIGFGDPFGLFGFAGAPTQPVIVQTDRDVPVAPSIILSAVNGVRTLDGTPTLTSTPILQAVNGIRSLDGTEPLGGMRAPIDTVVRSLDRHSILRSHVDRLFDNRFDPFAIPRREGFSVRSVGGDGQLVVESIVRGHVLYLELRDEGADDLPAIIEYKVRLRDGRALPAWIHVDNRGLVIVERPADADELRLVVTGMRRDGSRIELPILVQGETGEVQRDTKLDKRLSARGAPLGAVAAEAASARDAEAAALLAAFGG